MLCTTSAGTCARPREVIPFLLQSLNYAHCSFFFCTQLLKYIMITYTVKTAILHHPACHILCSLLSPHSYHLSVPSGIRSFYQWYGASASSSVKSRSRWEGWCWKDSRQGKQNTETFKQYHCKDGVLFRVCAYTFQTPTSSSAGC